MSIADQALRCSCGAGRPVEGGATTLIRWKRPLWLILASLAVLTSGCSAASPPHQAVAVPQDTAAQHPLRWPITLQYEHSILDAHGDVAIVERHEFSGRSWSEWTDIHIPPEGFAQQPGQLQVERYSPDGQSTIALSATRIPLPKMGS